MAFPFGGHPRLQDYVEALVAEGCKTKTTVRVAGDGRAFSELVITGPEGQHYIFVNPDPDERLTPHVVGNVQRRLGVKTHYASMPEQPKPSN